MSQIVILFVSLAFIISLSNQFLLPNSEVKFIVSKYFANCPDSKRLPIIYQNGRRMPSNQYNFVANYEMNITRDITNNLGAAIATERCKSKEKPDTCSSFATFRTRSFCKTLVTKTEFWSPFIANCMQPSITCPLKKGLYKGRNCTIDNSSFNFLPVDCSYYKIKVELMDTVLKEKMGCTKFEGAVCK